jgi:tRNA(Ile)-lysidine synthase
MGAMLDKVKRTIEKHEMLSPEDRVVVAVSGGVDSMVLLRALYEMREEQKIWLAVAHLDHQMRPDSGEDARFVVDYARSLLLPFVQEAIDVSMHIRVERLSPEEGARRMRYRFLARAARELDANVIALGHNKDDRVETFFLHLLRGAGLAGLAGIPPVRCEGALRYIRPLFECSRSEILAFARERALAYREDPTNRDRRYARNRVRWELLPLLHEYNPNVVEIVARAQETLRKAHEHVQRIAKSVLEQALVQESSDEIRLERQTINSCEELIQEYVLREAIQRVRGGLQGIESIHIEQMQDELRKARSGSQVLLPGGIRFVVQSREVRITRKSSRSMPYCFELQLGAENSFRQIGWSFVMALLAGSHPDSRDHLEARLDYDRIAEPLYVRNRRQGDRFEPLGLGGTKKLQDFFTDAKIPREERDRLPLICDQAGILWVVGWRISERCRVTSRTSRTLQIRAMPLIEE